MTQEKQIEQVFFNVPLFKLEPIFKKWVKDVISDTKAKTTHHQPDEVKNPLDEYIPKAEIRGKLASSSTLWHWEKKGKLKVYGIGGKRYYKRTDIENLFVELKNKKGYENE